MLWRGVGNDAVSEIEHERRVPQQIENFAHAPLKMGSAGKQEERIEIALDRQAACKFSRMKASGMLVSQPMASMPVPCA